MRPAFVNDRLVWPLSIVMAILALHSGGFNDGAILSLVLAQDTDVGCSETARNLVVDSVSGLDGVRLALVDAAECSNDSSTITTTVSVSWTGTVAITSRPLVVNPGVVLEIIGVIGSPGNTTQDAVVDSDNTTSLFTVGANSELSLANITLRGGWGGTLGGGAIYARGKGALVTCGDCRFESNSAQVGGGALSVKEGASARLEGSNVFERCTTLGGGGAVFAEDSTVVMEGSVIVEDCEAEGDGGGVQVNKMYRLFCISFSISFVFLCAVCVLQYLHWGTECFLFVGNVRDRVGIPLSVRAEFASCLCVCCVPPQAHELS